MTSPQNQKLYHSLRKKHPHFVYEKYTIHNNPDGLKISWTFSMSGGQSFQPTLSISSKPFINFQIDEQLLHNIAFHIGMIELVSYWKAACSPQVIIRAGKLTESQMQWWKRLYFNGLGEFFYLNGINAGMDDFMEMECQGDVEFGSKGFVPADRILVPVGGGKDSAVTLHLLKKAGYEVMPFILNPRKATLETAQTEGFPETDLFVMHRKLDTKLLNLNADGYLNGHTPFSALLAFVTLLAAALSNSRCIALSNESSANEPTIPGTDINHQFSKSFTFERDFRDYFSTYINSDIQYFSFLRPLNELQIGRIFAGIDYQHLLFRSCNAGSKTDSWCCKCPKCLFTWIILAPFLDEDNLTRIFGKNLLYDPKLIPLLEQLTGMADEKPFECVGTISEVNTALAAIIRQSADNQLPPLLRHYRESGKFPLFGETDATRMLLSFNPAHFLPKHFEKLLKEAIA